MPNIIIYGHKLPYISIRFYTQLWVVGDGRRFHTFTSPATYSEGELKRAQVPPFQTKLDMWDEWHRERDHFRDFLASFSDVSIPLILGQVSLIAPIATCKKLPSRQRTVQVLEWALKIFFLSFAIIWKLLGSHDCECCRRTGHLRWRLWAVRIFWEDNQEAANNYWQAF